MAILISPSNSTGWGLGIGSMYGGAKQRSDSHPVKVRGHYRAAWGSVNRRRPNNPIQVDPDDAVGQTIESVVAEARNYRRRRRRRRFVRRKRYSTRSGVRRRGSIKRPRSRRAAAVAADEALAASANAPRGNVYWIRDAATGNRVPVSSRTSVTV